MEVLALSSGESELGGLVRACTEGLGVQSVLLDFGIHVQVKLLSDATAAIGMVRRLGLGKVRHLATADLWIQQKVREGSVSVAKYPGQDNGADLMTKHKSRPDLTRQLSLLGFQSLPGRPCASPLRSKLWNVGQPVSAPQTTTTTTMKLDGAAQGGATDVGAMDLEQRSHITYHYPLVNSYVEGRRLLSTTKMPAKDSRILACVLDLLTGEFLYDNSYGVDDEPDLGALVDSNQTRPHLLLSWWVVGDRDC